MNSRREYIWFYTILTVLFTGFISTKGLAETAQDTQQIKLIISNVSLEKKTINPIMEQGKLTYKLSDEARVNISLYDRDDFLVKNVISDEKAKRGYNTVTLDGKDKQKKWLPPGAYTYVIEAESLDSSQHTIYDLKDESYGKELTLRSLSFDTDTGRIEYVLPKATVLRARVGMKEGGPLLTTLIDWQTLSAGRHQYIWNGNIGLPGLDLRSNQTVQINLTAYYLPDNSIIIQYDKLPENMASISELQQTEKRPEKITAVNQKYLHATHRIMKCREPQFSIEFPNVTEFTDDGFPIVSGKVPVRIMVAGQDKKFLQDERFEVVLFVDFIFLYEEEEGISPSTFFLDTAGINEGKHFLTVNLYGFKDHIGTKTKAIYIKRANK